MTEQDVSTICKALADSNRLKILRLLTKGEKCACELLESFQITQPTLSHHMKVLADCNLVMTKVIGRKTFYVINCETLTMFREYFDNMRCSSGLCL